MILNHGGGLILLLFIWKVNQLVYDQVETKILMTKGIMRSNTNQKFDDKHFLVRSSLNKDIDEKGLQWSSPNNFD